MRNFTRQVICSNVNVIPTVAYNILTEGNVNASVLKSCQPKLNLVILPGSKELNYVFVNSEMVLVFDLEVGEEVYEKPSGIDAAICNMNCFGNQRKSYSFWDEKLFCLLHP